LKRKLKMAIFTSNRLWRRAWKSCVACKKMKNWQKKD
jgi:hypothetical protein